MTHSRCFMIKILEFSKILNLRTASSKEVINHMIRYRAFSSVLNKMHLTENNQINPSSSGCLLSKIKLMKPSIKVILNLTTKTAKEKRLTSLTRCSRIPYDSCRINKLYNIIMIGNLPLMYLDQLSKIEKNLVWKLMIRTMSSLLRLIKSTLL